MAIADGEWNHGEGFDPTKGKDTGAWFDLDDGTGLTLADIRVRPGDDWSQSGVFVYDPPLHPAGTVYLRRMEGCLRPAAFNLPDTHPLYGPLGAEYVDQGAFEMFRSTADWDGVMPILVIIHTKETATFPLAYDEKPRGWRHIYRGFFSADGLVRNEIVATSRSAITPGMFLLTDNLDDDGMVERPVLATLANWNSSLGYYPIEAYPVLSVLGRSTTLNEQRYLQLAQAVKLLLTASDQRNPIYPQEMTPYDVDREVVVAFMGGSNGGMQASMACLKHPRLVHGAFAAAINPSYQRLYAEFDYDRALTRLTGAGIGPRECTEDDFLLWNQYAWSTGHEMHDLSVLRHFVAGTSYRSFCFSVGDEDTTSSGTNWARVLDGAVWRDHGVVSPSMPFGTQHTFGWMAGAGARHQFALGPAINPYTSATTWYTLDTVMDFWPHVIAQRQSTVTATIPDPAVPHVPRNAAQQLYGLDDPQEWWLGRAGQAVPDTQNDPVLRLDLGFHAAVNPGSTGTMPGGKEAMFIEDHKVYVGSADGLVTAFEVAASAKKELLSCYKSIPLGHACTALAPVHDGGDWWIVAGTRRHLHKLSKTLVQQASVQLPWEVAEPHHLACADVLPGHSGPEIVCATVHGGLCFFDLALTPLFEWPEPGIIDFVIDGSVITLLSARGVVAQVTFDNTNVPTLVACSRSIQGQLLDWNNPFELPSMGSPSDLEIMRVNWTALNMGTNIAAISLWGGDEDGVAVRGHWMTGLDRTLPFLEHLGTVSDIAVCAESPAQNSKGDHCLVLGGDRIRLFNQVGQFVGEKDLTTNAAGDFYPFGAGAHRMVVGELADSPAGSNYTEEVVIATSTGLMWMHVQEVAASGTLLPAAGTAGGAHVSGFWIEKTGVSPGLTSTRIQPRTNQSMQATWAMARRPGDDDLHVLDQRGAYWRVAASGAVQLVHSTPFSQGARGWSFIGPVAYQNPAVGNEFGLVQLPPYAECTTQPYCTKDSENVVLEGSGGPFVVNNWLKRPVRDYLLDGFMVHPVGGAITHISDPVTGLPAGHEAWNWVFSSQVDAAAGIPEQDAFANLLVGYRFAATTGEVTGIWSSTSEPGGDTRNEHHHLRNYMGAVASVNLQSLVAVEWKNVADSEGVPEVVVVLGCPGGRVRVLSGHSMRVDQGAAHLLGDTDSSGDLGYGGSALAVRHEVQGGSEVLRIWFAPACDPEVRPESYDDPMAALQAYELASSCIYEVTWTPSGLSTPVKRADLHPSTLGQRGAFGVVGMKVAELLPHFLGDELIVGTLTGDIIVYSIDPSSSALTERWRTFVPGAVGCYQGMAVEDLDSDNKLELYVASSSGLWRFERP